MSEQTTYDRLIFRIGGISAIPGALPGLVGNLLDPITPGPIDPEGTAQVVAQSRTRAIEIGKSFQRTLPYTGNSSGIEGPPALLQHRFS